MSVSQYFHIEYPSARTLFRRTANKAGFHLQNFTLEKIRGRYDEELSIDVASLGNPDAPGLIICNSGIHGVEGIAGSACQSHFLDTCAVSSLPNTLKLVFIHSLNPYGYSWCRRVNENNVDLNRNFTHFNDALPDNADYPVLHKMLLKDWDGQNSLSNIGQCIEVFGIEKLQTVLTKGQYELPTGLFYGGDVAQWSNTIFNKVLNEHITKAKTVAFLDIHTGLGPRGYGELIMNGAIDSENHRLSRRIFGDDIKAAAADQSVAKYSNGLVVKAFNSIMDVDRLAAVTLEFGTAPLNEVLNALREECWHHFNTEDRTMAWIDAKLRLQQAFYIADSNWQQAVIERFSSVLNKALAQTAPSFRI